VMMNMWMKGEKGREIFSVKSPKSTAIDRMGLPKEIAEMPMPTIVARQTGEAWTKPFVVIFEPSSSSQPKSIVAINSFKPSNAASDFVGLVIESKTGDKQFIFSATETVQDVKYETKIFNGVYGVISETKNKINYLFLGGGTKISQGLYSITSAKDDVVAVISREKNGWYFSSDKSVTLVLPASECDGKIKANFHVNEKLITVIGKRKMQNGQAVISFDMPAVSFVNVEFR